MTKPHETQERSNQSAPAIEMTSNGLQNIRCKAAGAEDAEIVDLALSNLAELLSSPFSADRSHMGEERADRWVARCNEMLKSLREGPQERVGA